jgi:hypothetical protein
MKLYYIGKHVEGYTSHAFHEFIHWFRPQKLLSHDIETNVCTSILDRILITTQYSDGETTWVLQWSFLTEEEQKWLLTKMNESHRKFVIHSSTFEYTVWLKYGVILKNIWDTYRTEQILFCGKGGEKGMFDLASVTFRRFGVTMSKEQQLLFGDDIMTPEKIQYAAGDVVKGIDLMNIQKAELKDFDTSFPMLFKYHKGLRKTTWWENEFSLVTGDLEYQGVLLDTNKWIDCYNKYYPTMEEAKKELDKIVVEDFKQWAETNGYLSDKDRFESIWGSTEKKKEILQLVFPNIESVTKLGLKEYLRDNDPDFPKELKDEDIVNKKGETVHKCYLNGKKWEDHIYSSDLQSSFTEYIILKILIASPDGYQDSLNNFFYQHFPEFMLNHKYVIPANVLSLNWSSWQQVLPLFQHIKPSIPDTKALTVEDNLLTHRLFPAYEKYNKVITLVTKYGLSFLDHVQADGRIRTVYNTVLDTGRLSAKEPNLLGLPKNNDYRACFIAPVGFKLIDADWDQQEITIIATLSKEPSWIKHLELGHDIHGCNAELVLGEEWKQAAEKDCNYYAAYQKCKCSKHKKQRDFIKSVDFGLSFGLSAYGLAARQHTTEEKAQETIDTFFAIFTKIDKLLENCAKFGIKYKYTHPSNNSTSTFIYNGSLGRVRFFDAWKTAKKQDHYGNWVYANPEEMRGVMRQSKNAPIQSFGADLLKVACVLLRRWINNNNLREHIQIAMPYHD